MKKIGIALIAFVFVEIAGFIIVGNGLGMMPTLLLIVLTSVMGLLVVKKQGTKALQEIQQSIQRGQAPGVALVDGFLLFIGAVLLVFPGFLTDLVGLLLLTPVRKACKPVIFFWLRKKMKRGQMIIVQR